MGTVNVGSRASACPLLLLCCVRGDTLSYKTSAPDQDAYQIDFQSRDPEITFLTLTSPFENKNRQHHR
jgi:hypothetical protein